jgi:hypothetical protein
MLAMATWDVSPAPDETCAMCGAVYEVRIHRLPARDRDGFECRCCGHEMQSWNSTDAYKYRLKQIGLVPPARYCMTPDQQVALRQKLMEDVQTALQRFYDQDRVLLEIDSNERSITHWLAVHLMGRFPAPLKVDCEYNRFGCSGTPKNLRGLARDLQAIIDTTPELERKRFANVSPDVAVHRRTFPVNLLVIEAKKRLNQEPRQVDQMKLRMFTSDFDGEGQRLHYTFGLFIVFRHKEKIESARQMCDTLEWYEEGVSCPAYADQLREMLNPLG